MSTASRFWSFGVNWLCRGLREDDPGPTARVCFSRLPGCLPVPCLGIFSPRSVRQHAHPLKRIGCERGPELPLPRRWWASQPSTRLVQLLRRQVRISHSSVQIRAAEPCSSAPLEMCEIANRVRVPGSFRCSKKEFIACFFLTGQESKRLQLCCSDRLANVRAGIMGGSCWFGS